MIDPTLTVILVVGLGAMTALALGESRYQARRSKARRKAAEREANALFKDADSLDFGRFKQTLWKPRASLQTPGGGWKASAGRMGPHRAGEIHWKLGLYTTKRAADVGAVRLAARLNDGQEA